MTNWKSLQDNNPEPSLLDAIAHAEKKEQAMMCHLCGDYVPERRALLGYRTCLTCGEQEARQVQWCTAPINKSNYTVITNRAELAQLNPKRTS